MPLGAGAPTASIAAAAPPAIRASASLKSFRPKDGGGETPVSLGYDRIRFTKPVFIGDTITVVYRIDEIDTQRRRSRSQIEVTNQDGEVVAVGQHILKWVPNPQAS